MPSALTRRVSKSTGKVSWTVQVRIGTRDDGRPKWLTRTFGKQRDAKVFLTQTLKDREDRFVVEPSRITVNEYLDKWLEDAVKPRVRRNTYSSYEWQLKKYVRDDLGTIRLQSLHPLQIQRLYSSLTNRGLSPRVVRYTHTILNNAFGQAIKWRLLTTSPCAAVELPRRSLTEAKFLTSEEAVAFVKELRGSRHEALFVLALLTGMRPSEYIALGWKSVDFDTSTVRVQRTVEWRHKGKWRFSEPKTPKSRRSIPIPVEVLDLLKNHRKAQLEMRMKAGADWVDHDLVFSDKRGGPLDRQNLLRRHFRPMLKKAGLNQELTLYSLRHSCASMLLAAGIHAKVIAERLGHASVVITLDRYSHLNPDLQGEATARLGEMVFSSGLSIDGGSA
jgi:integrase